LPHELLSTGATVESCINAARAQGLAYAGVQYGGQCFAGNTLGYAKVAETDCNMRCSANAGETCGGAWRNSIYAVSATTCTPTTCAAQGKNCGSISNECGGTLNCGTCTAPATCGGGGTPNVCGGGHTYSTPFPATENPLSEGGKWVNGKTTGLDWTDILTLGGTKAYGTSTGSGNGYDDSTAVLQNYAKWGPNQTATGVVYVHSPGNAPHDPEVELRLNTTISAHSITGYECTFSVKNDGTQYAGIARWNGPFGNFTGLVLVTGNAPLANGDTISCSNLDGTISLLHNGKLVTSAKDTTFTGGSPGIGTDLDSNGASLNGTFGFSHFSASD
jgi:hypothetical protein